MREQCDVQESTKIHEKRAIHTSLMIRKRMSRDNCKNWKQCALNHILSSNKKYKKLGVFHFILFSLIITKLALKIGRRRHCESYCAHVNQSVFLSRFTNSGEKKNKNAERVSKYLQTCIVVGMSVWCLVYNIKNIDIYIYYYVPIAHGMLCRMLAGCKMGRL